MPTSSSSSRFMSKAMNFPSGDQQGNPIISLSNVSCFAGPPSTGAVQILIVPPTLELKAICFPSGETRRDDQSRPHSRRRSILPDSISSESRKLVFSSYKWNASRCPPGNQLGVIPRVSILPFLPSESTSQMSELPPICHTLYATFV